MDKNRRNFIKKSFWAFLGLGALPKASPHIFKKNPIPISSIKKKVIISTWSHGLPANKTAWQTLATTDNGLDAIESALKISEADPKINSVGYGGYPDREGKVTLDACIMEPSGNCGAVAFLQNIKHPISVARKVMEKTPHVLLVGEGALQFALGQGFQKENLLTPAAEKAWKKWLKKSKYVPKINIENHHDTISMLLLDEKGNLYGGCTTSGMAWKIHGRVGDSPMIGASLFLDNEVGAAAATGLGEAVIRTAGSAMVVELMRQGANPLEACKEIVNRIEKMHKNHPDMKYLQVGFIALNKNGQYAGYSLRSGFNFAVSDGKGHRMEDADFTMGW